jgi:Glycosyl transferases group 1
MIKVAFFSPPTYNGLTEVVAEGLTSISSVDLVMNNDVYNRPDIGIQHGGHLPKHEFWNYALQADLVLFSCPAIVPKWQAAYREQLALFQKCTRDKCIFIDVSDNFIYIDKNFTSCRFYFKREKRHSYKYPKNVKALPLAICSRYLPAEFANKDIKYSFMAKMYSEQISPRRKYAEIAIARGNGRRDVVVDEVRSTIKNDLQQWTGGRASSDYLANLNRSMASISVRGYGCDTFRYWEILANKACLISEPVELLIEIPNELRAHQHYIPFKSPAELDKILKNVLEKPEKYITIGEAGHAWAVKYHAAKSRAELVLNAML